jgi:hypothetical protein
LWKNKQVSDVGYFPIDDCFCLIVEKITEERKVEEGEENVQIYIAFTDYEETFGRFLRHTVGDFDIKRISRILKTSCNESLYKDTLTVI